MASYETTGQEHCKAFVGDTTYNWVLKKSNVFYSDTYNKTVASGKVIGIEGGENAVIDCDSIVQDYTPAMLLPDVMGIYSIIGNGSVYQGQETNYNSGVERFGLYLDGNLADEWIVLADYSGESWDGSNKALSCPINGHIDARQIITTSFFSNAARNIIIEIASYPPSDEIWYTSTGGTVVAPYLTGMTVFGANIISNTYTDKGIIKFDNSITSIGDGAFYQCPITTIAMPYTVTTIGEQAFQFSSLSSITLGSGVTSIGNGAFWSCGSLSSVIMPDNVTSFGELAFGDCPSLLSVVIGSGVTSIAKKAFQHCYLLSSITIGSGVTSIGEAACYACSCLSTINYKGTMSQWGSISKGVAWRYDVPATVIHCIDGDVQL